MVYFDHKRFYVNFLVLSTSNFELIASLKCAKRVLSSRLKKDIKGIIKQKPRKGNNVNWYQPSCITLKIHLLWLAILHRHVKICIVEWIVIFSFWTMWRSWSVIKLKKFSKYGGCSLRKSLCKNLTTFEAILVRKWELFPCVISPNIALYLRQKGYTCLAALWGFALLDFSSYCETNDFDEVEMSWRAFAAWLPHIRAQAQHFSDTCFFH